MFFSFSVLLLWSLALGIILFPFMFYMKSISRFNLQKQKVTGILRQFKFESIDQVYLPTSLRWRKKENCNMGLVYVILFCIFQYLSKLFSSLSNRVKLSKHMLSKKCSNMLRNVIFHLIQKKVKSFKHHLKFHSINKS